MVDMDDADMELGELADDYKDGNDSDVDAQVIGTQSWHEFLRTTAPGRHPVVMAVGGRREKQRALIAHAINTHLQHGCLGPKRQVRVVSSDKAVTQPLLNKYVHVKASTQCFGLRHGLALAPDADHLVIIDRAIVNSHNVTDDNMGNVFLNGRHDGITVLLLSDSCDYPTVLMAQTDCVVLLADVDLSRRAHTNLRLRCDVVQEKTCGNVCELISRCRSELAPSRSRPTLEYESVFQQLLQTGSCRTLMVDLLHLVSAYAVVGSNAVVLDLITTSDRTSDIVSFVRFDCEVP